jgi:hypothetical protein
MSQNKKGRDHNFNQDLIERVLKPSNLQVEVFDNYINYI